MNKDSLEEIFDSLQIFWELKRENRIIYAWIQLKKFITLSNERERSIASSSKNGFRYIEQIERLPLKSNHISPIMNRSQLQTSPHKMEKQRFVTEATKNNLKDQMFQTFNKYRQSNDFSNEDLQTYRFQPQKVINPIFPTLYEQVSDNEQFEDIVLDRLSQLQQKINKLMHERRMQQEQRGYVGVSIRNKIVQQNNFKDYVRDIEGDESLDQSQQEEQQLFDGRERYYEQCKYNNVKEDQSDKIYKLKYIPMLAKQEPDVNIHKIKQLIQNGHRKDQQIVKQNKNELKVSKTIDGKYSKSYANNNSFNGNKTGKQKKFRKLNFINNKNTDRNDEPEREKGSTTLYLNRYGVVSGSRNTNQVHFIPKHIQMQTVIEQGSKYLRKSSSRNINIARFKNQNYLEEQNNKFNGKVSHVSNSSSNSQISQKQRGLNNKSALY